MKHTRRSIVRTTLWRRCLSSPEGLRPSSSALSAMTPSTRERWELRTGNGAVPQWHSASCFQGVLERLRSSEARTAPASPKSPSYPTAKRQLERGKGLAHRLRADGQGRAAGFGGARCQQGELLILQAHSESTIFRILLRERFPGRGDNFCLARKSFQSAGNKGNLSCSTLVCA